VKVQYINTWYGILGIVADPDPGIGIRDPVPFLFLDPRSGIWDGSKIRIRIRDE